MYYQRNCNCEAELKPSLSQSLITRENGSLSKHPIKDANFFLFLRYIK